LASNTVISYKTIEAPVDFDIDYYRCSRVVIKYILNETDRNYIFNGELSQNHIAVWNHRNTINTCSA
jgi:hypothetical protein